MAAKKAKVPKPQPAPKKGKTKPKSGRGLTAAEQQLKSDIKRANQRLREIEKKGQEGMSSAYQEIKGLFYSQDIVEGTDIFRLTTATKTPNTKGKGGTQAGKIMFRTDIARMKREDPEKLELLKERVRGFLESQTSTIKGIEARRKKVEAIRENLFKKYGYDFTEDSVNRMIDDEVLYNRLRQYVDSETAHKVMTDISQGELSREDVMAYLDEVEAGGHGFSLMEMYNYHSTTSFWDTDW